MRFSTNSLAFISACLAITVPLNGMAAELYLFDILRRPGHRAIYDKAMASGHSIPPWIKQFNRDFNGAVSPSTDMKVGNKSYLLSEVCKPHDCPGNSLRVVFDSDVNPSVVWVQISSNYKTRWIGNPPLNLREAIDKLD